MMRKFWIALLSLGLLLSLSLALALAQPPFTIELASISSTGAQANDWSTSPSISSDGRYVAFESGATNLVPNDTNDAYDIFVHDRQTGQTTRVSVSSAGVQGGGESLSPSISADGRYVAFESIAANLVTNLSSYGHIFVHDRQLGLTTLVSINSARVQGNGESYSPSISADGRYVAFANTSTNLVTDDTNDVRDIFVHDRLTGQTTRVSISSAGEQGNSSSIFTSISADGRYVAFQSIASNLVTGDTNIAPDIFVHDRQTGQTTRVSLSSDGLQGNSSSIFPSISADGRYVAFDSRATNLVPGDTNGFDDIFVHDRQTGQTTRVSLSSDGLQGNSSSIFPSISADGRYVAFVSSATNLVPDDTNSTWDIFVHDRLTGLTRRVSISATGAQANGWGWLPSISADGRYVAFDSEADNLVSNDTNGWGDVFVASNPLYGGAPPSPSTVIAHMEITQVIQDEGNDVPLIAGKPTFVRVYVHCGVGCTVSRNVTGVLRAYNAATNQELGSVSSVNGSVRAVPPTTRWQDQRGSLASTLNFTVPMAWVNSGTVRFRAEVDGAVLEVTRQFQPSQSLRIAWVGIPYGANGTLYYPNSNMASRGNWFAKLLFPVAQGNFIYFPQPARSLDVMTAPFHCDENACPADDYLRALTVFWAITTRMGWWVGGSPPDRLYGWVPPEAQSNLCGIADARWGGDRRRTGLIAAGLVTPDCGGETFAHELGHVLNETGLTHAPGCYAAGPDPAYPNQSGHLDGWGFETLRQLVIPPEDYYDLMSYCKPRWISIHNYRQLINGFSSSAGSNAARSVSGLAAAERQLLVSGTVSNPSQPTVAFHTFYPLTSAVPADVSTGTAYCLQMRSAGEAILESRCFDLDFINPETRELMNTDSFVMTLPYPAEARSVVLTHLGTVIGQVTASNNAPSVEIIQPNGGETWSPQGVYTVNWTANDPDADALRFVVAYSADGGVSWMPIGLNIEENHLEVVAADLPGSTNALFRVIASDQMNTASDDSDAPFTVGAKAPSVAISSPPDNTVIPEDTPLFLQGTAYDLEDGHLTDTSMSWTSSQDGALGTGEIILTALSIGQHTITLTAIDSAGNPSSTTIMITVQQGAPQPPPTTPELLTPANGTFSNNDTPVLTWNAVAGATIYRVQVDNSADFSSPEHTHDTGTLSHEVTALADGLYYWRVQGMNADGEGPWSAAFSFTIDTVSPNVPTLLAPPDGITTENTRPVLTWALSTGANRYQLRLDRVDPPVSIATESPNTSYRPDAPLPPETHYWQVRALDQAGNASDWSAIQSFTIVSIPGAAPLRNYIVTNEPITLTWSRISRAIAYEIQIDDELRFATPLILSQIVDGTHFEFTISSGLPLGTYHWRVRAQQPNGSWGAWSTPDSFIVDVP